MQLDAPHHRNESLGLQIYNARLTSCRCAQIDYLLELALLARISLPVIKVGLVYCVSPYT